MRYPDVRFQIWTVAVGLDSSACAVPRKATAPTATSPAMLDPMANDLMRPRDANFMDRFPPVKRAAEPDLFGNASLPDAILSWRHENVWPYSAPTTTRRHPCRSS